VSCISVNDIYIDLGDFFCTTVAESSSEVSQCLARGPLIVLNSDDGIE